MQKLLEIVRGKPRLKKLLRSKRRATASKELQEHDVRNQAEHLPQVGSYHILMAIEDDEMKQQVVEHLVKMHLPAAELTDDEDILRLGEENQGYTDRFGI